MKDNLTQQSLQAKANTQSQQTLCKVNVRFWKKLFKFETFKVKTFEFETFELETFECETFILSGSNLARGEQPKAQPTAPTWQQQTMITITEEKCNNDKE